MKPDSERMRAHDCPFAYAKFEMYAVNVYVRVSMPDLYLIVTVIERRSVLDVGDLNLAGEIRQRHGDVVGCAEALIGAGQVDAFDGAVVGGADDAVVTGDRHRLRAVFEDAALAPLRSWPT